MVYFNYVAHHSFDSCKWKWGSHATGGSDWLFLLFFLFKHITSLCVHLKKNNVVHYRYVFTQPFKQWLRLHNWAQNVSKSSVTRLMDCTDPRLLVMTHRSCLCFGSFVFFPAICSVSERQVREGLRWDLPLHQQWHLQPHRWLLPVLPRLDRRRLLSGCAYLLHPAFDLLIFLWSSLLIVRLPLSHLPPCASIIFMSPHTPRAIPSPRLM